MAKTNIVVHIVWATFQRRPLIPTGVDAWLAHYVRKKAQELDAELLAVGNASDHVHVVACMPAKLALSELVFRLKGASSRAAKLEFPSTPIGWQESYWAESFTPEAVQPLLDYVGRQRLHHQNSRLVERWESDEPHRFSSMIRDSHGASHALPSMTPLSDEQRMAN